MVIQSVSVCEQPQKPGNEAVVIQSVSACGQPQKPGNETAAQLKSWFKARAEWLIQEGVIHACVVYVPSLCTDHVEDVVTAVFQYLAMIRREGPKEWIFKECAVRDRTVASFPGHSQIYLAAVEKTWVFLHSCESGSGLGTRLIGMGIWRRGR